MKNPRQNITSPARRRVWLLGALRVETQQGPVAIPPGNVQHLFARLILFPNMPHTREQLANLLWPEAPPERVGRYFSSLLYRLHKTLGEGWLVIEENTLLLPAAPDLWVDIWDYEQLVQQNDPASLEQAIVLYAGDLLPEIYADWILPRRTLLREYYLASLLSLGQWAETGSQLDQAFTHYHRLSFADPLNEEAHRGLMRVYARLGRQTAALQQYHLLAQSLAEELQVEPLPETQALAEAIRAEHQAGRDTPRPPPFVGRRGERSLLLQQAELALTGCGSLLLLEGEAGVGKTRLLQALAEGAGWRGLSVVWGQARELEAATPYGPLAQALQTALAGPRADQLRPQLSLLTAETLAGLVPRLRPGPASPLLHQPNLPLALAELLGLLTEQAPYVFILDDVHWADLAFWEALKFTAHIDRLRLLVILAYRPAELRSQPSLWEALNQLDHLVAPRRLALAGLSLPEAERLAREVGYTLPAQQLSLIHQATAGNPLYLQESLAAQAVSPAGSIPLKRLLHARLEVLPRPEREALELAAVLGREFTYGLWQTVGGSQIYGTIPELMAGRFIQETDQGYIFQHDLTREQVYQTIPAERLRELHAQVGEALIQENAAPETLAWHFEQAGLWPQAVKYHRMAGERAMRIYAYQAACDHFDQALAYLPQPPDQQADYLTLLCLRQRVGRIVIHGGYLEEWRANVAEIERVARLTHQPAALLEALEARLRINFIDSDLAAMEVTARQALELLPEVDDPIQEASFLNTLGFYLSDTAGQPAAAIPHLQRAIQLAEATQEFSLMSEALCNLAFAQLLTGRCYEAQSSATQALALAELRPEQYPARAHALAALGLIVTQLADWEQAYSALRRAMLLYEELFDNWNLLEACFNFALVASIIGQHQEAIQAAKQIMSLVNQAGVPADSEVSIWYQTLLARSYLEAGNLSEAGELLQTVEPEAERVAEGRGLLVILISLGQLYLAQNQPAQALPWLARAVQLWNKFRTFLDMKCLLLHALAAHRAGALPAAKASLAQAQEILSQGEFIRFKVLFHFVQYEISGAAEALVVARNELQRQAALFKDERLRLDFLSQVQLHREIETRWQALLAGNPPRIMRLARLEAPLGRPLTPEEQVEVQWTVDAGEIDRLVLQQEGQQGLRRYRLQRLLSEAAAQGAAPTDAELAQTLAVSRRTILRDMAYLARLGFAPRTRRRKSP